jgi:hypothetical protein
MQRIFVVMVMMLTFAGEASGEQRHCQGIPQAGIAEEVTVSGLLSQRTIWGPPNFGENPTTDSRIIVWIVRLDSPLKTVLGSEFGRPGRTVSEEQLQIFFQPLHPDILQALLRQRIVATGTLEGAVAPGETTRIVMNVETIERTSKSVPTICVMSTR